LGAALVNPLIEHILDPLEAHLEDLATLADTWQRKLVAPTQEALEERAQVREEIARYKTTHGLG
jgi:chorismate mutase